MNVDVIQVKAARGLLEWTQEDLAHYSGISLATIRKFENRLHIPRSDTMRRLVRVFENFGVEFIGQDGVRLNKENFKIEVWEGVDSILRLLEDIQETLTPIRGEMLLSGLSESQWEKDYAEVLNAISAKRDKSNIKRRFLICEGDTFTRDRAENYRWVPEWLFAQTPYYVYADKLALITWEPKRKVVLIHNKSIAETFRRQFNYNWDMAKPVQSQSLRRKQSK